MMFRVVWLQVAVDELMTLWMQSDSDLRQAITAASHTVDQRLANDPLNEGESRPAGSRITFVAPLAVRFHIDAAAQTVTVLHVRVFRRRQN
jgi:hypothetical protein